MLTREAIASYELPREEVFLEEYGESVYVQSVTGRQFLKLISSVREGGDDLADMLIPYLPSCVLDADGKPLFEEQDVDRLPFSVLAKLVSRLAVVSGLHADTEIEAGKGE